MAEVVLTSKHMKSLEVTVRIPHMLKFRMWLGLKIIEFGLAIFGASVKIEAADEA